MGKKILNKYPFLLLVFTSLLFPLAANANTGGVCAVISSQITPDGRPLLWGNINSDNNKVALHHFSGFRYNFTGLVHANDTLNVWGGLNTAGFAITFAKTAKDTSHYQEGLFIKMALGRCGRLSDFEILLNEFDFSRIHPGASFACFDAFGNSAMYETNRQKFNAFDPLKDLCGFLVRDSFTMTGDDTCKAEFWRYHRANKLLKYAAQYNQLSVQTLLRGLSRDLTSLQCEPYPLPFESSCQKAPIGLVPTDKSLNQHNTVASLVIHGVKPGENVTLSTMWCILGEPIAGTAVPLWPVTGEVPGICTGRNPVLNEIMRNRKKHFYHNSSFPQFIDSYLLAGKRDYLGKIFDFEKSVIEQTWTKLEEWQHKDEFYLDIQHYQKKIARKTARVIRF